EACQGRKNQTFSVHGSNRDRPRWSAADLSIPAQPESVLFESSRSTPSSGDAQRNRPYRRNGVTSTNRVTPHQNMPPPSFGPENNPSATPKARREIHRRRSRALIARRLPEASAKSEDFPQRHCPPYENLPRQ